MIDQMGKANLLHPERRYPKEVILKDGEEVQFRPMIAGDEKGLCRFYAQLDASLRWYLKEDPADPGVVPKWIRNQEAGRAFSVLAVHQEQIVAHASLLMRTRGGRRHVGRLRVYVAEAFRRGAIHRGPPTAFHWWRRLALNEVHDPPPDGLERALWTARRMGPRGTLAGRAHGTNNVFS